MRVLVVCSGNLCRSPMAVGILQDRARRSGRDLEIRSAGTVGIIGLPPMAAAIEVCRERGIDIAGQRSSGLDAAVLRWSDHVLCMAREHVLECRRLSPSASIVHLGDWSQARHGRDIADPVGQPLPVFRMTYDLLLAATHAWLDDVLPRQDSPTEAP